MSTGGKFLGLSVPSWALALTTVSPLLQCVPAMFAPAGFAAHFGIAEEKEAKMIGM